MNIIFLCSVSLTCKKWQQRAWKALDQLALYPQALATQLRYLPLAGTIDFPFFADASPATIAANIDAEPVFFHLTPYVEAQRRRAQFLNWLLNSLESRNVFSAALREVTLMSFPPDNVDPVIFGGPSTSSWTATVAKHKNFERRVADSVSQFTALGSLRWHPSTSVDPPLPESSTLKNFLAIASSKGFSLPRFKNLVRMRIKVSRFWPMEDTLGQVALELNQLELLEFPIAFENWETHINQLQKLTCLLASFATARAGGFVLEAAKKSPEEAVAEFAARIPKIGPKLYWRVFDRPSPALTHLSLSFMKSEANIRAFLKASEPYLQQQPQIRESMLYFFLSDQTWTLPPSNGVLSALLEADPTRLLSAPLKTFLPRQFDVPGGLASSKAGYSVPNSPCADLFLKDANFVLALAAIEGSLTLLEHVLVEAVSHLEPAQRRGMVQSQPVINSISLLLFQKSLFPNGLEFPCLCWQRTRSKI